MKISYVMQCFLGEYNKDVGGRCKNPEEKLIRAVKSVLDQEHQNVELILVSDGCISTKEIYFQNFKKEDKVKFVYIDKQEDEVYNLRENRSRGLPREVGRTLVDGDVTTYLDADDIALPTHAKTLAYWWSVNLEQNKNYKFCINNAWYDHETVFNFKEFEGIEKKGGIKEPVKIKGIDSKWLAVGMPGNDLSINTGLISHISSMPIKWEDNYIKGLGEDTAFGKKAIDTYLSTGDIFKIEQPIHVRCHNIKCWDY